MPLFDSVMQGIASAAQETITRMRLHHADPGQDGGDNLIGSPMPIVWGDISGPGTFGLLSGIQFVGLPQGGPVGYLSLWNIGLSTCYGTSIITGDPQASSDGKYTVTACDLTGVTS